MTTISKMSNKRFMGKDYNGTNVIEALFIQGDISACPQDAQASQSIEYHYQPAPVSANTAGAPHAAPEPELP